MSGATVRVAVVGDRLSNSPPQDGIHVALQHSAAALGTAVDVTWYDTPTLASGGDERLGSADAVWCAPGSPFLSMEGALAGIRFAREHRLPFLGTCAGFQHGVIEIARNVLGFADAAHAEATPDAPAAALFIDELLCSLVGQAMHVRLVDEATRDIYGADDVVEQYYCRFGLKEEHRGALHDVGLEVAGVDVGNEETAGATRIMRLAGHPFFYLTLFVPQTSSTASMPHPIITAYLEAALHA